MNRPLCNIAIVVNLTKAGSRELTDSLVQICQDSGVNFKLTEDFPYPANFLDGMDVCFSVGGDGTLLSLLDESITHGVPVAGIGLGKLGFLATLSPENLQDSLPALLRGDYRVCRRSLIGYREEGGGERLALNDLIVKSGVNGRIGQFSVVCGKEKVADFGSDGIVFSTPTGSTAYNLAAGGPITHPQADVILMTPISSHSLTSRPLVFPSNCTLQVTGRKDDCSPVVFADGAEAFPHPPIFPLELFVSTKTFPLMETLDHSYFRVLRNKLKWG